MTMEQERSPATKASLDIHFLVLALIVIGTLAFGAWTAL